MPAPDYVNEACCHSKPPTEYSAYSCMFMLIRHDVIADHPPLDTMLAPNYGNEM